MTTHEDQDTSFGCHLQGGDVGVWPRRAFQNRPRERDSWIVTTLRIGIPVADRLDVDATRLGFINPFFTYSILGLLVLFFWAMVAMGRQGVSARRT